ncbi:MAG: HAD family phosphatase [Coriobacteriales bacterium]|nr:HAD family phosphatase [Coriobacteriales bacterium]
MRCSHAFFDIDNTLTDNRTNTVPASLREALALLEGHGIRSSIATGRSLDGIPEEVRTLYPWFSYVTYNGQLVYDGEGKLLRSQYVPQRAALEAMRIADVTPTTLEIKTDERIYRYNEMYPWYRETYRYFNMEPWEQGSYSPDDHVIALMASREADASYDDLAAIDGLSVFPTQHCYADINLDGASKFSGSRFLQQHYGFDAYMAFGDSENDRSMLEHAELSIAMGDASVAIKALCDLVTGPAGEDGILHAVEMICSMV